MNDMLRIEMIKRDDNPNNNQMSALFSSSGVPNDAQFTLDSEEPKQTKLKALDLISGQKFVGSSDRSSEYYMGIRRGDVLEIHPLSIFRMNPIIELNERHLFPFVTPLSKKEQMEEMKEKFGSRKIQRSLASKRKYAIEFGEEDVEQIDTKTKSIAESAVTQSESESTINDSLDILPKQNRDAICVQEVYDLNEIITEFERNVLTQFEDKLFQQIDNSFIKQLNPNPNSENKLIAIYINLLITILNLKSNDLRKADPLPTIDPEVKEMLFSRYLNTQVVGGKTKYVLSSKQKDRLLIYGIILSIILHNFRPIDLELLQKTFKVPNRQMRKIVEIIGAYIENMKNPSGVNSKLVVFKIPLNTFSEKKTFKRR